MDHEVPNIPESECREVAVRIASQLNDTERDALLTWSSKLLEIRQSSASVAVKTRAAIKSIMSSKLLTSVVKIVAREIKRVGWDNRGKHSRLGITGAVAGLAAFGSQGAGIAALGTAIGVPLWVVFGAGAAFASVMIEEIQKSIKTAPQLPSHANEEPEITEIEAVYKKLN